MELCLIKLSHSARTKFKTCGKSYDLRYNKKLVSRQKGSALYFGSAIDVALNYMLENKDYEHVLQNSLYAFEQEWLLQKDNKYDLVSLPENEDVAYFKSDFDYLLLGSKDLSLFPKNLLKYRENVEVRKKDIGWYNLEPEERVIYNHSCWISLREKGFLFIKAYHEQILPKIKRVIAVQMPLDLVGEDGSTMTGFIDAVVELQDGRVVVLDNKTSSKDYEADSVAESEQLALYMTVLNVHAADPTHSWNTHIDACAYAVLNKKLNKVTTKTCKSCGHSAITRATSCDSKIGKKRCGGEWTESHEFTVSTQFLVDNISEMMQDAVLTESEKVIEDIKSGVFEPNFESCKQPYGLCEYYYLCHENSMENLIDITGKKKDNG